MVAPVNWHFEVDVATKGDMAFHLQSEKERSKRHLGVKISHCNSHHLADQVWIFTVEEARTFARTILGKADEVEQMQRRLDQDPD